MKVRRSKKAELLAAGVAAGIVAIPEGDPTRKAMGLPSQGALARPRVLAVPFKGVVPLVTLDHPEDATEGARGAFARLRPPETLDPGEVASWRESVAAVALAVRVVPQPRRAGVPTAQLAATAPTDDVRREATELAAATGDPDVVALVERVLAESEATT